jgi:hypothetical protein
MEIAEFLLARVAEDEAVAREAVPSITRWLVGMERTPDRRGVIAHLVIPADSVDSIGRATDEVARTRWLTTAPHIARWDPARVLAECEAKRRIIAFFLGSGNALSKTTDPLKRLVAEAIHESHGDVLKPLAQPYADHPDYRAEWLIGTSPMTEEDWAETES